MHCHGNARLTPRGRAEVFAAVEAGMTVSAACLAFRISRRTYYRWRPRWRAHGEAGLVDRSSRPWRSPHRVTPATEREVARLRESTGFGPDRLAILLGMRQTWMALTPSVRPVHSMSSSGRTSRRTDVIAPGPDRQRKVEPDARGPTRSAVEISGFHRGHSLIVDMIVQTTGVAPGRGLRRRRPRVRSD